MCTCGLCVDVVNSVSTTATLRCPLLWCRSTWSRVSEDSARGSRVAAYSVLAREKPSLPPASVADALAGYAALGDAPPDALVAAAAREAPRMTREAAAAARAALDTLGLPEVAALAPGAQADATALAVAAMLTT